MTDYKMLIRDEKGIVKVTDYLAADEDRLHRRELDPGLTLASARCSGRARFRLKPPPRVLRRGHDGETERLSPMAWHLAAFAPAAYPKAEGDDVERRIRFKARWHAGTSTTVAEARTLWDRLRACELKYGAATNSRRWSTSWPHPHTLNKTFPLAPHPTSCASKPILKPGASV